MRLGKHTARLVRQAAVAGFVNGTRYAQGCTAAEVDAGFPRDSYIVASVLRTARAHGDNFPTLAKVESVDEAADAAEAEMKAGGIAMLRAIMGIPEQETN